MNAVNINIIESCGIFLGVVLAIYAAGYVTAGWKGVGRWVGFGATLAGILYFYVGLPMQIGIFEIPFLYLLWWAVLSVILAAFATLLQEGDRWITAAPGWIRSILLAASYPARWFRRWWQIRGWGAKLAAAPWAILRATGRIILLPLQLVLWVLALYLRLFRKPKVKTEAQEEVIAAQPDGSEVEAAPVAAADVAEVVTEEVTEESAVEPTEVYVESAEEAEFNSFQPKESDEADVEAFELSDEARVVLERLLKFDTYYEASDDHAVWRGGHKEQAAIAAELAALPPAQRDAVLTAMGTQKPDDEVRVLLQMFR